MPTDPSVTDPISCVTAINAIGCGGGNVIELLLLCPRSKMSDEGKKGAGEACLPLQRTVLTHHLYLRFVWDIYFNFHGPAVVALVAPFVVVRVSSSVFVPSIAVFWHGGHGRKSAFKSLPRFLPSFLACFHLGMGKERRICPHHRRFLFHGRRGRTVEQCSLGQRERKDCCRMDGLICHSDNKFTKPLPSPPDRMLLVITAPSRLPR